jgi:predicted nuclease of predicted toxin-antitoxin system
MRFLIDADLPRSTKALVESFGHEAIDVREIGMGSADDAAIAARAQGEQLCLLTGDFGFADVRNYPPAQYAGLVIFELPKDATAPTILRLVRSLIEQHDVLNALQGRLAIVSPGRVRLRPKT